MYRNEAVDAPLAAGLRQFRTELNAMAVRALVIAIENYPVVQVGGIAEASCPGHCRPGSISRPGFSPNGRVAPTPS